MTKHFIARWPDWHPDDVAITNDPWLAAGHLHDVALAVPVLRKLPGAPVEYVCSATMFRHQYARVALLSIAEALRPVAASLAAIVKD